MIGIRGLTKMKDLVIYSEILFNNIAFDLILSIN